MTGISGEFLLFLLTAVIVFAGLARVLKVPYPILLMIAGLGLSFAPQVPRYQLPPDLVFSLFLPPLLYSAAWTLSWREFKRNVALIAMLAFGLVLVTIACLMLSAGTLLPGFTWKSALLLGAVVATTDAIAATAVGRRLGLPHSLITLLEAESLVNDATALLALQFGLGILMTGHTPGVLEGFGQLIFLTAGGVAVGLVVAVPIAWIERWIDDGPIEIVISALVPYVAYLIGQHAHVSGVIAVIACSMYMSRQSYSFMSAQVRLQATAVWEALTFVLNGLIFVLLGLQMPFVLGEVQHVLVRSVWLYGAVFSAALITLRMLWIFLERYLAHVLKRWLARIESEPPSPRELTVIGWGGMRGVLSLAAAVSLPLTTPSGPLHERGLIIFLAFALIFSTLVLQGLTLPLLIRWLGLADRTDLLVEEREARRIILREALAHLNRRQLREAEPSSTSRDLIRAYRQRLEALSTEEKGWPEPTTSEEEHLELLREVLEVERATMVRLRDEGEIDDEVLRVLQRELDLTESRVQTSTA